MKLHRDFRSPAHAKAHLSLLRMEQAVVHDTPLARNGHYMSDLADEIRETEVALTICTVTDLARERGGVRGGPMS